MSHTDRANKIIAFWILGFGGLAVYLYTEEFFFTLPIILLAGPLRNNIYEDESFSAASEELPRLSKIVAFSTLLLSLFFVNNFFSNGHRIEDHAFFSWFPPLEYFIYIEIIWFAKNVMKKNNDYCSSNTPILHAVTDSEKIGIIYRFERVSYT